MLIWIAFSAHGLTSRQKKYGLHHIGKEVIVLLSATYLHDIGMQFIRPDMLAHLPSLPDEVKNEAAKLTQESINEQHRQFARRYHHLIAHDWIVGSRGDIGGWPNLAGLEGRRLMVARVALGHNIWLTDKESYDDFKKAVRPSEEPEGTITMERVPPVKRQDHKTIHRSASFQAGEMPITTPVPWRERALAPGAAALACTFWKETRQFLPSAGGCRGRDGSDAVIPLRAA